jgi:hypothetical protein
MRIYSYYDDMQLHENIWKGHAGVRMKNHGSFFIVVLKI